MFNETELIILIVGNCGSGKTWLARRLAERLNGALVDDPKDIDDVENLIHKHRTIVIADPWFCLNDVRQRAGDKLKVLAPYAQYLWYFFENNPEQCRKNIEMRSRESLETCLPDYQYFSQYYDFPAEATFPLIPVYKGSIK